MHVYLLWILLCAAAMLGCDRRPSAPPPPSTTPTPDERITGSERLGWVQQAGDAAELATFRYAIYVDNARSELTGAACATTSISGGFECNAPLPALRPGAHTLELASYITDSGTTLESTRSAALRVTVGLAAPGDEQPSSSFKDGVVDVPGDRTPLLLELVAEGVNRPTDLAFTPDRRLVVAEESGRIRILHDREMHMKLGDTSETSNGEAVLALAIDPDFERTHFVYALSLGHAGNGQPVFIVARFREAGDTLADRVVLLDRAPATASHPSGSLRFGPDGKLFVAFDAGANASLAADLASFSGKVLRLNPNGTTPDDQAGASPLYSLAYRSPRGLDWGSAGELWVLDAVGSDIPRISAVVGGEGSRRRGVTKTTIALPETSEPSSLAAYRGALLPSFQNSLLVASSKAQHLLRVRLDPNDPTKVIGKDRLLQNRVGGVRVVVVRPGGAVYFATETAIGRLVPAPTK